MNEPSDPVEQPTGGPGDVPPPPSSGGSSPNAVMLVLAYLGIFCLIPLLVEKNDEEVQWHAKNGLVLMLAEIVLWVVLTILGFVPLVNIILIPVMCVFGIGILVLHIVAIVKAVQGERWRIPMVTDYAEKL